MKLYTNLMITFNMFLIHQISHMEVEFGTLPAHLKPNVQPRLKSHKDDLKKFKTDHKKIQSEVTDREALLGGTPGHVTVDVDEMNQRGRLLQGTERLNDGSRRLEEAKRVALETGSSTNSD